MPNTLLKELKDHAEDVRKNGNLLSIEAAKSWRAISYITRLEDLIYRKVDPSACSIEDLKLVSEITKRLAS